jgi:all-trans-retinol dehydrogenase (NAD+)
MASHLVTSAMEGIAIIGRLALSPLVSGPLVLASAYAPGAFQKVLTAAPGELGASLQSLLDSPAALPVLRALFALSLLRLANNALNRMASNAWRLGPSPGWDWPNEIAVVTGGSSGIGRSIVEGLVAIGVRVAVLDIQDLPPDMRDRPLISFHRCDVTSTASVAEAAAPRSSSTTPVSRLRPPSSRCPRPSCARFSASTLCRSGSPPRNFCRA